MSNGIDDGGPAYPAQELNSQYGNHEMHYGMSLRDYLAGQALIGILTKGHERSRMLANSFEAYEVADFMLRARKADLTEKVKK